MLYIGTSTYISNIDNTSHEEETSNNRRKTKSLHCPQLDHHDTDGLAGHKFGGPPRPPRGYFNILTFLYMRPLFYGEFADFTILYLQFLYLYSTDNMY
jgi:hypothetical protein